jgi:parallel beta-helix repeat protein
LLIKKILVIGIIILFLGVVINPAIAINQNNPIPIFYGNILYVGGTGEGNYSKIQDAINDASDGDTVYVYDDSSPYIEHLTIMKSIIISGENKNKTKIYGNNENKDIILIQSNGTTIYNFTIQYSSVSNSGILIKDSSNITISKCNFFNISSMDAITISNSENVNIFNCLMSGSFEKTKSGTNDRYISGITLEADCSNTTISGNYISNASYAGIIILAGCNNTKISSNNIYFNDICGIEANYCNNTYIGNNIISNNKIKGIVINNCKKTHIYRNSCENNNRGVVKISDSTNSLVESNNFINKGLIGCFGYNLGEGFQNKITKIKWKNNYWNRPRLFPKLILGSIVFQKNPQSPIIIIPWINFDWNPAKVPYNIGI